MHHRRPLGRIRRTAGRIIATALLLVLASLGAPSAALAHGADGSDMSLVLVRQAIAYIVNTPGNMDATTDKINDATEAEDQSEVKIPLVEQAKQTLDSGDMHKVRALLEQAIGARVHIEGADPVQIGAVPPPATGEDTATLATIDALPGRGGLSGGDWTLLVISIVVGLLGLAASVRLRPQPQPQPTPPSRPGEAS